MFLPLTTVLTASPPRRVRGRPMIPSGRSPAGRPDGPGDVRRVVRDGRPADGAVLLLAATVTAETATRPPPSSAAAHADSVAPVVATSSTRTAQRPGDAPGRAPSRTPERPAPRSPRGRPDPGRTGRAWPERAPGSRRHRQAEPAAAAARAARPGRSHAGARGRGGPARAPGRRRRRPPVASASASTSPSTPASRRSPPYLRSCSAPRTTPSKGAHQSSWTSGGGTSAGRPSRTPPGRPRCREQARPARCADRAGPRRRSRRSGRGTRDPGSGRRGAVDRGQAPTGAVVARIAATGRRLLSRTLSVAGTQPRRRPSSRTESPTAVPDGVDDARRQLDHAVGAAHEPDYAGPWRIARRSSDHPPRPRGRPCDEEHRVHRGTA